MGMRGKKKLFYGSLSGPFAKSSWPREKWHTQASEWVRSSTIRIYTIYVYRCASFSPIFTSRMPARALLPSGQRIFPRAAERDEFRSTWGGGGAILGGGGISTWERVRNFPGTRACYSIDKSGFNLRGVSISLSLSCLYSSLAQLFAPISTTVGIIH